MGKKKKQKRKRVAAPIIELPRYAADGRFLGHELATRAADGSMRPLETDEVEALRYRSR